MRQIHQAKALTVAAAPLTSWMPRRSPLLHLVLPVLELPLLPPLLSLVWLHLGSASGSVAALHLSQD